MYAYSMNTTTALPALDVSTLTPKDAARKVRGVEKMTDVTKRVQHAARLAAAIQEHADGIRRERDQAGTALHIDHGYKPVKVYRVMGLQRTLFWKTVDRNVVADDGRSLAMIRRDARRRGLVDFEPPPVHTTNPTYRADEPLAWETIRSNVGVVEQWDQVASDACRVRDQGVFELFNQGESNVDLADLTRLTSARVAQMRKQHEAA